MNTTAGHNKDKIGASYLTGMGKKAPETEGQPGEEAAQQRIMSSVKSMVVKVQLEQLSGVISDSSARPQQQSAFDLLHMARRPRPFITQQSLLGNEVFTLGSGIHQVTAQLWFYLKLNVFPTA